MASTTETQGFFTSNGVLRSEQATRSSSSQPSSADAEQSRSEEAARITDDAVYTATTRLNSGGTGFDSGVAERVGKAVSAALQKIDSRSESSATPVPKFTGGTYQNEILRGQKATPPANPPTSPAPSPEPESPPSAPVEPNPAPVEPRRPGRGRGRGSGRGSGRARGGGGRRSVDTEA